MQITLAFAKHNWIAFGKAKLELDWIFQFNDWITTALLLDQNPHENIPLLLATTKTTGLLWKLRYYWITLGEGRLLLD